MRVKACTHGCLWATSVTSLSKHTLGLEQEQKYSRKNALRVKMPRAVFTDEHMAAGEFMSTARRGARKDQHDDAGIRPFYFSCL